MKYVFANFGYLVLFGLFPAVFLAYSLDTATVGAILRDYFTGSPYASFSDIFQRCGDDFAAEIHRNLAWHDDF